MTSCFVDFKILSANHRASNYFLRVSDVVLDFQSSQGATDVNF